jgi:hypothetical protein
MVVKSVIGKIVKILVNPRLFWQRYDFSSLKTKDLQGKVYPLIMAGFFAIVLFGSALNRMPDEFFGWILLDTFVISILLSISFFLIGYLEYWLCRSFGIATYCKALVFLLVSMLPFYLLYAVLSIFPSLFFLWILVLYSLYVMYFGALYFLKIPGDRIVIFIILSVLLMVLGIALSVTLDGVFMGLFIK